MSKATRQVRIYEEDYKLFKQEAEERVTTMANIIHEKVS